MTRIGIVVAVGLLAWVAVSANIAAAQSLPTVRAERATYFVGRDTAMAIHGHIPAACAGQSVTASLFLRDGAEPSRISSFPGSVGTTLVVANDGAVTGDVPLPSVLPAPVRVFAGIAGACLPSPVVDDSLGAELAVVDAVANPGLTSSVLLSPAGLASVGNRPDGVSIGAFLSSLTALADGRRCVTSATDPAVTKGANVVLRLGLAGQPAECSKAGAALSFETAAGTELFVTMTLTPGTTRLLDNFARTPVVDGPSPNVPRFRTDKTSYIRQTDHAATITVAGLASCAGQQVQIGLFLDATNPRSELVAATVGAGGEAEARVPLPENNTTALHPGVSGACLSAGAIVSGEFVNVFELDPKAAATAERRFGRGGRGIW